MHATLYRVPALAAFVPVLEQLAAHTEAHQAALSPSLSLPNSSHSQLELELERGGGGEEVRREFAAAGSEL